MTDLHKCVNNLYVEQGCARLIKNAAPCQFTHLCQNIRAQLYVTSVWFLIYTYSTLVYF